MKKYLVIGNPIEHSLSPKLHNFWMKKNKIDGIYTKQKINENEINKIISEIKNESISGINITVPFKKIVIPFLDKLTPIADKAQSVNMIFKENNKLVGHNTDVEGFELAIKHFGYDIKNKKVFIIGAGGVVPSIILALRKMNIAKIILSNRTKKKSLELKSTYNELEIIDWGDTPDFDIVINATSLGLNQNDIIPIDYKNFKDQKLFYDVIYNPKITNFLNKAKQEGHLIENGKMMFIYQAHQAFTLWHKKMPQIDEETIRLLEQ